MKTSVLMLGCLLATASLADSTTTRREVWAWKDADGVTHYSDYPAPGARKIVLVGATPTTVAPSSPPAPSPKPAARTPAATEYTALEIWSPEPEATFFGTGTEIVVRIRSEPSLAPGDRLLTYLDGKLLESETPEHQLTGLERGAHRLEARIISSKGVELMRSAPVTFYIRQPTVIDNPRNKGPALRPQPTPSGR